MPSNSLPGSPPRSIRYGVSVLLALILLSVLGAFFHESLRPEQILFSNDGPLGALTAYAPVATTFFTGAWHDLNWLGIHEPSVLPNITFAFYFLLGPVGYSKLFVPIVLFLLGVSAWLFFRQLRFSPWICAVGALAAALNMDSFSYACWGLPSVALAPAMVFLALAAVHSAAEGRSLVKLALAGMAVGMAVMEAFDVGAIFSLYVAAFTLFLACLQPGPGRIARGVGRVALVAVFAGLLAAQALSTLIATQIQGVVGMQQDQSTREQRWNEATQWSLPKIETLRLIVPGLFGYRMDTPNGGNYWGTVGQDAAVPGLLDEMSSPDEKVRTQAVQALRSGAHLLRHSGSGEYAGVLVVLLAAFALAQSLRKKDGPYSAVEKKCVWFWSVAALISLLLAFGRHAPFYRLVYALPYFSTIRNPIKFLHPLHLSLVILFGYGLAALHRRYLATNGKAGAGGSGGAGGTAPAQPQRGLATAINQSDSLLDYIKAWLKRVTGFEKKWTLGMGIAIVAGLLGWLLYASSRKDLIEYLQRVGFDESAAGAIARFSLGEVGWFLLFLVLSALSVLLVMSGALAGRRVKWAGILLGLVLVADLVRANAPWIVYYNYREKYASNPVIDFLHDHPYEKRVTELKFGVPREVQNFMAFFQQLYGGDWVQHLFQYYRVQSLDIVQMPREKKDYDEFMVKTFSPMAYQGRLWQLTSTRYLLGLGGFADALNQNFDPVQHRFRVHTWFTFNQAADGQIQMVVNTNGPLALIEDGAALPRASLFSQWQVSTNDAETLKRLTDSAFDPEKTVLVADPLPAPGATNAATDEPALTRPSAALSHPMGEGRDEGGGKPGTVSFTHYEPKFVQFSAWPEQPSVLLFNDRFDPNWKVWVDGRPEKLLRCNYLMRGVFLQPGQHTVKFRFQPPVSTLYVSLATLLLGVVFCGVLVFVPDPHGQFATNPITDLR